MKIGELAQQTNCSTETIRYYEKIGLLSPALRDQSNYRLYTSAHKERLQFIRNCRSLDMTHEEIRDLLVCMDNSATCQPATEIISEHLQHVELRIQELLQLRQQLHQLQNACDNAGAVDACGILNHISTMPSLPDNKTHLS